MINFEKLTGPFGIPVYFQRLPDIVRSVSLAWVMFAGGADDESIGAPGLYHWFEHVPFRGTKKYPSTKDIKDPFTRNGGMVNAFTNQLCTSYYATAPSKIWKEALSIVTDLMTEPLLGEAAISAEREIIVQEITKRLATAQGKVFYDLPGIIWPGHPFGHFVLGNEGSLRSMTGDQLRMAHRKNYDRSRCALFAVGDLDQNELLKELDKVIPLIPDNGLSSRQKPEYYGPLPAWNNGKTVIKDTNFQSSIVLFLFPVGIGNDTFENYMKWDILADMFNFGNLDSPVMRILREERNLVYSSSVLAYYVPGGGYWGFAAEAQDKNVDPIIKSFQDVLTDPETYSSERIKKVKTGLAGSMDIRPVDPAVYRYIAVNRLLAAERPFSDEEYLERVARFSQADIEDMVKGLDAGQAFTVIFRGKNNS